MKTLYKTLLMAGAVMFIATGAYADNYNKSNKRTESQGYNSSTQMNNQQRTDAQSYDRTTQTNNQQRTDAQNYNRSTQANNQQQYGRLSNADIRNIQKRLNEEGHNLEVDGVWGLRTTNAIRDFQRQNDGLSVTGDLDPQTLAELGVNVNGSRDR